MSIPPSERYEVWRQKPIVVSRADGRGAEEIPVTEASGAHASLATAMAHAKKNKTLWPDGRWSVLDTETGDEWDI